MKALLHCSIVLCLLFGLSCARQTAPTGGPKDSIPPTLISSTPRNGDVNFQSKSIELTFSEPVLLNNPREQLIITPDLGKPVDARAKKNQITIVLEDDLKQNTTYSINFREAVQDVTEKNPAERLKLAFSTGSYIDSLSVEGTIIDVLNAKEAKDATIALFESDTFNIFFHRPSYLTKSDAKGIFKIENLKPGSYYVYGFDDKNKNLLVDSKTESYGFIEEQLNINDEVVGVQLPLVRLDSRPLRLTSARPAGTFFNIKTTKSLKNYVIGTSEDEIIVSSFGEDLSNVRIYNTFEGKDSVSINFTGYDSLDNSIDTAVYVKFAKRELKPEAFQTEVENLEVIGTKGVLRGEIRFNKPLLSINFDSIFYNIDSVKRIPITQEDISWDSLRNRLRIQKKFDKALLPQQQTSQAGQSRQTFTTSSKAQTQKARVDYQFYLGDAAFISIELDSSKRSTEKFQPTNLEDTGMLLVQVDTDAPNFFVELLSNEFKLITSKRNAKKFNFEDLKPGDYQMRLVIDEDNDGTWDPGNFFQNRAPEKIVYYRNEKSATLVNLKANWELGPLLITDQ